MWKLLRQAMGKVSKSEIERNLVNLHVREEEATSIDAKEEKASRMMITGRTKGVTKAGIVDAGGAGEIGRKEEDKGR